MPIIKYTNIASYGIPFDWYVLDEYYALYRIWYSVGLNFTDVDNVGVRLCL